MFVPIGRTGIFLNHESHGVCTTLALPHTKSFTKSSSSSSSVSVKVPVNLFNYSRVPRWSLAKPVHADHQQQPQLQQQLQHQLKKLWQEWLTRSAISREFDLWSDGGGGVCPTFQSIKIRHITDINSSEAIVNVVVC